MGRIRKFWTIFFAVLGLVATASAVYFACMFEQQQNVAQSSTRLAENSYKQAIYNACDSMKNIDATLGKVAVSTSAEKQAKMLADITVHANNVNQKLAELPIEYGDNLEGAQRFVNQTQDYAKYLLGQLQKSGKLSSEQRKALANLDDVAKNFYQTFVKVIDGNAENADFDFDSVGGVFDEMENDAFAYEKLIYDGPFSDSVVEKQVTAKTTLTTDQVAQKLGEMFQNVQYVCKISHKGDFYCFDSNIGRIVTSLDGKVAEIDGNASNGEPKLSKQDCIDYAEKFAQKLGYNVKGIWVSKTQDGVTYVNLAPVISDVIVYPEIVKIAVDNANGNIVGLEARAYLINHKERASIPFGSLSEEQAKSKLDGSLNVVSTQKALVLSGEKQHICYQFECEFSGRQYFVYVDSTTGEEVEIFKVIENTEGYTVM